MQALTNPDPSAIPCFGSKGDMRDALPGHSDVRHVTSTIITREMRKEIKKGTKRVAICILDNTGHTLCLLVEDIIAVIHNH